MKTYRTAAYAGLSASMERRFDFFMGLISTVFPIVIQVFLWQAVYGGSQQALYGYTFSQMMLYVVMAGAVNLFVGTDIEFAVNEDIHSGTLGVYLCKPVNYVLFRVFNTMGKRVPAAVTTALFTAAVLLGASLFLHIAISPLTVLLFIPALLLGVMLNFCIFFLISLSGLWLTEAGNFFAAIRVVIVVISGGVFPVTVLGDGFAAAAKYLPFSYTTFFPVSVITQAVTLPEILRGGAVQLVWILLLGGACRAVWGMGMRKYVAVGG